MEIVGYRAPFMFAPLWVITRVVGRSTLGELSTFELLLYVTMGDLVQSAVTQQDFSVTVPVLSHVDRELRRGEIPQQRHLLQPVGDLLVCCTGRGPSAPARPGRLPPAAGYRLRGDLLERGLADPPTQELDHEIDNARFRAWVETTFNVEIPQRAADVVACPAESGDLDSDDVWCRWVNTAAG